MKIYRAQFLIFRRQARTIAACAKMRVYQKLNALKGYKIFVKYFVGKQHEKKF